MTDFIVAFFLLSPFLLIDMNNWKLPTEFIEVITCSLQQVNVAKKKGDPFQYFFVCQNDSSSWKWE